MIKEFWWYFKALLYSWQKLWLLSLFCELRVPISEAIVTNSNRAMVKISMTRMHSAKYRRCDPLSMRYFALIGFWNPTNPSCFHEHFPGNEWNSENCYSESENVTREGVSSAALSVRSNLSKSPVEEYWEWVGFMIFAQVIIIVLVIFWQWFWTISAMYHHHQKSKVTRAKVPLRNTGSE